MLKKMILIAVACLTTVVGVIGLAKNSKKIRIHRIVKKMRCAMYNIGTMLRFASMQSVQ